MTSFNYPILTAEQQYDNLLNKGLDMNHNKQDIIFFLTHHSYFKLMLYFRPYWSINANNERVFNQGVSRNHIVQDYHFDHELRILLFSYIIDIENSFKNTLCQFTCQKLGNTRWEDLNNFDDPIASSQGKQPQVFVESINPILSEILLGQSKHEHVQKYIERGLQPQNPPFRNMIEVFTFGQVVKMYRYLADLQVKKDIGRQYHLDESKLRSWMKAIVDARNICCHHNKLFDKINWKTARVRAIEAMLDQKYDTVYHVCCLMQYLLKQIRPDNQFMIDLKVLLEKYKGVNTSFPDNWEDLWK